MALPETLKDRPDDAVKLLRAHQKAVDFINQHPAEADRIMADAFKLQSIKTADGKTLPPEALVGEARKRIQWSVSLTQKDGAFFEQLMKDSQSLGYMQKAPTLNEFVDTQWLKNQRSRSEVNAKLGLGVAARSACGLDSCGQSLSLLCAAATLGCLA